MRVEEQGGGGGLFTGSRKGQAEVEREPADRGADRDT